MHSKLKAGYAILIPAFLIYFFSESVLRQSAVANVEPGTMNVDSVIAKLPSGLREAFSYRLDVSKLRDAIARAPNDVELAVLYQNLADILRDPLEKEDLYYKALNLIPDQPEVSRAYTYFLLRKEARMTISIPQYHRYIAKLPPPEQFYTWNAGLATMRAAKMPIQDIYGYLAPLASERPAYRDFRRLYEELADISRKMRRSDMEERAKDLEDYCFDLPSIDESLSQDLKKKIQVLQKK